MKASDCTLGVPNDYISILEIIKLQPTDRQRRTDQSSDRVEIDTLKKKERHQMEREIDLELTALASSMITAINDCATTMYRRHFHFKTLSSLMGKLAHNEAFQYVDTHTKKNERINAQHKLNETMCYT